jgi:prephenate dehydrogenase
LLEELAGHLDAVTGGVADGVAADAEAPGGHRTAEDACPAITAFLERGNRGRALVPVKRGDRDEAFRRVAVEVDDRPGRLAALLTDAGAAGVNVEDVRVDHVPGRPRGVIELLVHAEAVEPLTQALRRREWAVVE